VINKRRGKKEEKMERRGGKKRDIILFVCIWFVQ
jgi:hypothetical protein